MEVFFVRKCLSVYSENTVSYHLSLLFDVEIRDKFVSLFCRRLL